MSKFEDISSCCERQLKYPITLLWLFYIRLFVYAQTNNVCYHIDYSSAVSCSNSTSDDEHCKGRVRQLARQETLMSNQVQAMEIHI